MTPPRRARRLALLAALAALLLLLGGEIYARALDARRGYSPHARAAWYWLFEQDPYLGYRGRPHAFASLPGDVVRHNADGFRDGRTLATLAAAAPGRLVVCLGDGNTYGLTAGGAEAAYPARLERELRSRSGDARWTVMNAGMPGYTSHEMLQLLKLRLLRLRPAWVVLMSLANDHEKVALYLDDAQDLDFYPLRLAPFAATRLNDWLMRSVLVGRLAERLRRRVPDDLGGRRPATLHPAATARGVAEYRANLALAAVLAGQGGARLALVDPPIHFSLCNARPGREESYARMRRVLRDVAAEHGLPVLEAESGFDWERTAPGGDLLLGTDEYLLGAAGYAQLAERLAPQLLAAAEE